MEPLTLYFDRNVGRRLPEALKLLHLPDVKARVIHHHTEKHLLGMKNKTKKDPLFKPDEKDDKWLEYVGMKDWVVFSQDKKFHKPGYESELYAIKQFNVGCFYLWGATAQTSEKALVFLKAYDKILHAIKTTPKPFIYDITRTGRLVPVKIK